MSDQIQFRNFSTNSQGQVTSEYDSGSLYEYPIRVLQKDIHEKSLEHHDDRALNNSSLHYKESQHGHHRSKRSMHAVLLWSPVSHCYKAFHLSF